MSAELQNFLKSYVCSEDTRTRIITKILNHDHSLCFRHLPQVAMFDNMKNCT